MEAWGPHVGALGSHFEVLEAPPDYFGKDISAKGSVTRIIGNTRERRNCFPLCNLDPVYDFIRPVSSGTGDNQSPVYSSKFPLMFLSLWSI